MQSFASNGRAPASTRSGSGRTRWTRRSSSTSASTRRSRHVALQRVPLWRQVSRGSTPGEVKVLLGEPRERTIDPALMASLGEQHWAAVRTTAKEAWVYPLGWVVFFDDKGAVVGPASPGLARSTFNDNSCVLDLGVFSTTPMPSTALTWIEPGASATLIWHGAAAPRPGGGRLYVVSGPILEQPPASPYFILPPRRTTATSRPGSIADRWRSPELRAFLSRCRVTRGRAGGRPAVRRHG